MALVCARMLKETLPVFGVAFVNPFLHLNGIFLTFQSKNFSKSSDYSGYIPISVLISI